MNTIALEVVQEDIDASEPGSNRCSALCFAAMNRGLFDAIFEDDVWYPYGDSGPNFPLPDEVKQFMRDVDDGKAVKAPVTFQLPWGPETVGHLIG